ncbi:hypothetical protein CTEN210_13077 [Chaetoceros tenuissimus]|uniref:Uncharacterized protein n=1 Tax=Chaetoceros tenuissimus TaxID=426638 RepID=A0AAD3D4I4_9STRA|nr:hypothetical protein CTEN210_13077 [Chaetoceros tenuissimus]
MKAATHTKQFTVADVGFWKDKKVLSRKEATLKITNQKNGKMGQTIHHSKADKANVNAVAELNEKVHHLLSNRGNKSQLLSYYWDDASKQWQTVTPKDMITEIRTCIKILGLDKAGIDPDLVGVHSLRADGAMTLKLAGIDDIMIMKMGHWSGLTFTMYIHNQIGHLSKGLAEKMATTHDFTNIAAIEPTNGNS